MFLANILILISYFFYIQGTTAASFFLGRESWYIIFLALLSSIFTSSLFIFINFKEVLQQMKRIPPIKLCCGLLVGTSLLVYDFINIHLWTFLSRITTLSVTKLLVILGLPMIKDVSNSYMIQHPSFGTLVGAPCSGLEGVFFFIAAFSFILMIEPERPSRLRIAVIYCIGIIYMFVLNIVRITFFFLIALWAVQKWGQKEAAELYVSLFHGNIGWLIYTLGLAFFFALLFLAEKKNIFFFSPRL
jgi:exosortase/archaeosortase family protein